MNGGFHFEPSTGNFWQFSKSRIFEKKRHGKFDWSHNY